jgi:hypothetical protein
MQRLGPLRLGVAGQQTSCSCKEVQLTLQEHSPVLLREHVDEREWLAIRTEVNRALLPLAELLTSLNRVHVASPIAFMAFVLIVIVRVFGTSSGSATFLAFFVLGAGPILVQWSLQQRYNRKSDEVLRELCQRLEHDHPPLQFRAGFLLHHTRAYARLRLIHLDVSVPGVASASASAAVATGVALGADASNFHGVATATAIPIQSGSGVQYMSMPVAGVPVQGVPVADPGQFTGGVTATAIPIQPGMGAPGRV